MMAKIRSHIKSEKFEKTPEQVLKFIIVDLVQQLSEVSNKLEKLETKILKEHDYDTCSNCKEIFNVHLKSRAFPCRECNRIFCSECEVGCDVCEDDLCFDCMKTHKRELWLECMHCRVMFNSTCKYNEYCGNCC